MCPFVVKIWWWAAASTACGCWWFDWECCICCWNDNWYWVKSSIKDLLNFYEYLMNMRHSWRSMSVVWTIIHFGLNFNRFFLRFEDGRWTGNSWRSIHNIQMMMKLRIVHWIQIANFDVLIKIADIGQFLFANVALINHKICSWGRWYDWNIFSVFSTFLLMS